MKRLWARSLSGRLVGVLLLALALSQGVSLFIYRSERTKAMRNVLREECVGRATSAFRLAEATPPEQRAEVLETVGTLLTRYWLTETPPESGIGWQRTAKERLLRPTWIVGRANPANSLFLNDRTLDHFSPSPWEHLAPDDSILHQPARLIELSQWNGFGLAIELDDGTWLNTVFAKPAYLVSNTATRGYYAGLAFTAVIFVLAAWYIALRISRPLRRLTQSAEKLGRGGELELLAEEGPDDIRSTLAAFNRMQIRLRRFIEDRTRMLAAIGHDLRTPITSLRLRAEFVADEETRGKLVATLDEMQAMSEAALAFARSEAESEPSRSVDLAALLESLCDDLADLGWDVEFVNRDGRLPYLCRPDALRRAVRNVIENAVRYGDRARVFLHSQKDGLAIVVEDDGPGIEEADRERVFAPFVRLEGSRNRSTGGVGLGLAIARSILRNHGGDIVLACSEQTRFTVNLQLPHAAH